MPEYTPFLPAPADDGVRGDRTESPPGAPSRALRLRAADGWERFMRRVASGSGSGGDGRVGPDGYEQHPLVGSRVRDIASGGEGVLTAVTHEVHSDGRVVRVAHVRPASGVEWTTAAGNVQLP